MTETICPHCAQPRWEYIQTDPAVHYLPETDMVAKCRNGTYLRVRAFYTNTESQYLNKDNLGSEYLNCKISISECDATGDVLRDRFGSHIIYGAEVKSFRMKALVIGQDGRALVGFDGALGKAIASLLDVAEDSAAVRRQFVQHINTVVEQPKI